MKKVLLFVSIGLIILTIPATVFLVGKNQEIRKRAAPASTLSLSPSAATKKVGDTFTLEAKIDTGTNQVGVVQIRVTYDPAKLQGVDITNGHLAPSISVSGKIDATGKASITVGAKNNATPITGSGTVAVLTMKAIAASASPVAVRFTPLPDTYANALGEQDNVIIGTTPANITILNVDGTQATSETALITTPDATPSAALTLSPTPVATESAEASPSAVTIDSIEENEQVATDTPTFSGKAPPGSTVTLTIYSEPTTVVLTVDENGNWSYTPEEPLEDGPHTVTAMVSDPTTGETSTTSVPFVLGDASESGIPVSGSVEVTLTLIAIGVLFMLSGIVIPIIIR